MTGVLVFPFSFSFLEFEKVRFSYKNPISIFICVTSFEKAKLSSHYLSEAYNPEAEIEITWDILQEKINSLNF